MMTKLEQDQAKALVFCLPIIAESLASIAESLKVLRVNQSEHKDPRS